MKMGTLGSVNQFFREVKPQELLQLFKARAVPAFVLLWNSCAALVLCREESSPHCSNCAGRERLFCCWTNITLKGVILANKSPNSSPKNCHCSIIHEISAPFKMSGLVDVTSYWCQPRPATSLLDTEPEPLTALSWVQILQQKCRICCAAVALQQKEKDGSRFIHPPWWPPHSLRHVRSQPWKRRGQQKLIAVWILDTCSAFHEQHVLLLSGYKLTLCR